MNNRPLFVCANCGSADVEVKAWVDANTLAVRDIMDGEIVDTFCNVCNDHHGIEISEPNKYKFMNTTTFRLLVALIALAVMSTMVCCTVTTKALGPKYGCPEPRPKKFQSNRSY